ncbi:MAG: hypothetical protein ACD_62C00150G0002 [uncultured bacterium]|nr:MAG: hypothetical protein ACD_62C00150G0002 [uncultured bacterium]HLD43865.1 antitoxin [bacterium]
MKNKLTAEEKDLLDSYERGEWKKAHPKNKLPVQTKIYAVYARHTIAKDSRVNIRVSSKDIEGLQKLAIQEGIPYQTLIASILHNFVSGRLARKA